MHRKELAENIISAFARKFIIVQKGELIFDYRWSSKINLSMDNFNDADQ